MKVAALDLGTNTFLCLIVEGDKNGISKVLSDQVRTVRLGQDVNKTGMLHPEALIRAKEALEFFKSEIDKHNVDNTLAMATSAARDAKNGHELFKIGETLGIPIQTIPGSDEARISYAGATFRHSGNNKKVLVVDIGGGSTELILGQNEKLLFAKSINIGGVRLTEKFITKQPVIDLERVSLQKDVKEKISASISEIQKIGVDEVLAVAGTPTSLATIELGGFSEERIDGFVISKEKLKNWNDIFAQTSVEEKKSKYNLGGRADIIFSGTSILLEILEQLKKSGFTVSTKGLRYGIALEMLK